jgi:hypothetical protein
MGLSHGRPVAASGTWAPPPRLVQNHCYEPADETGQHSVGTYLTVFKKQAGGSWRVVEDFSLARLVRALARTSRHEESEFIGEAKII